MIEGQFSRTALGAAGHRAAHQLLEGGRIFADPLALRILGDEAEAAWRFADSIRVGWNADGAPPPVPYASGTGGPGAADELFRGCEGVWGRGE